MRTTSSKLPGAPQIQLRNSTFSPLSEKAVNFPNLRDLTFFPYVAGYFNEAVSDTVKSR